jgi:NAD dependent epimerase/dehydratase family enzyme
VGAMSDVLLSSQRVQSLVLDQNNYQFKFPQLESAIENLK